MSVITSLRWFVVLAVVSATNLNVSHRAFAQEMSEIEEVDQTDPQDDPVEQTDEELDEAIGARTEPPPRALTPAERSELDSFKTPTLTDQERAQVLERYKHVDKKKIIPRRLLDDALIHYHYNLDILANKDYLSIIDYSDHSKWTRFYIIDMKTGDHLAVHVAHGSGSDKNKTGWARLFGNTPGSNRTSLGFMRTAETYIGKHGLSLRLDGLSSTNSNVRDRAIVVHGARYVYDQNTKQGNSWGCPAVSFSNHLRVINMIKGGSLILAGLGDP